MDKRVKTTGCLVMLLLVGVMSYWLCEVIRCEYLTGKHYGEFEYAYLSGTEIEKLEDLKVLHYSDHAAEVYYTEHGMASGNVVSYVRYGAEWVVSDWEILWDVWDEQRNPAQCVWPYLWDYIYAYSCENNA